MKNLSLGKEGFIAVFSSVLFEAIYIVRNKAVKVPDKTLVIYELSEIHELYDLSGKELRFLHEGKRAFGGKIV